MKIISNMKWMRCLVLKVWHHWYAVLAEAIIHWTRELEDRLVRNPKPVERQKRIREVTEAGGGEGETECETRYTRWNTPRVVHK